MDIINECFRMLPPKITTTTELPEWDLVISCAYCNKWLLKVKKNGEYSKDITVNDHSACHDNVNTTISNIIAELNKKEDNDIDYNHT